MTSTRSHLHHHLLLLASLLLLPSAQALVVGSYNIRYANRGDAERGNGWEQRAPVIAGLVRFHAFDVLGLQEALHSQLQTLQTLLPEFAYVGHGRDDGKDRGEHAAILYRKSKLRLLDTGDFWFSDTPSTPSKGWDAALPRICTWAKFQSASDARTFHVFNLHLDHVGVRARLESTRLVVAKIQEIAGDQPALLMGDFNLDQHSDGYRVVTGSGRWADAFDSAPIRYALNGTANAFDPNAMTESRIDHIFLSPHFKALRYGVLTDSYRAPTPRDPTHAASPNFPKEIKFRDFQARLPSDHFPVLVEVAD